jgi:type VI secretion system protein ImpJ
MSQFSRTAWKEGDFMVPQHFQQAFRSLEAYTDTRVRALHPLGYGLRRLEFDAAALSQGRVEVRHMEAVLPDGLTVVVPEHDAAPPPRAFTLPTNQEPLTVYVAIPARRPRIPELTADRARADIRYLEQEQSVADDYAPEQVESIRVAVKNLRLIFAGEALDGQVVLPLARIVRDAEGRPTLQESFVPPCLSLAACEPLEKRVKDLLTVIEARAAHLSARRRESAGAALSFNAGDIESFWFLHTLLTELGPLRQQLALRQGHPFDLYLCLLRLAGGLEIFSKEVLPPLAPYNHDAPGQSFDAVDRRIRQQVRTPFTLKHEIISLKPNGGFWNATLQDRELLASGTFLLGVIGPVTDRKALGQLEQSLKLAEADDLERIVSRNLEGVPFRRLEQLPATMPARGDAAYYTLDQSSPLWAEIRATGEISAFLPGWLKGFELELVAIRSGEKR